MRTDARSLLLILPLAAGCSWKTKVTHGVVPASPAVLVAAPAAENATTNLGAPCAGDVSPVILRVTYGTVLCVRATADRPVLVDVGQNLISLADRESGLPDGQVYYSLAQVVVPPGESRAVPAVCGGNGAMLAPGTEVATGPRMPEAQAVIVARLWATLVAREQELAELRARASNTGLGTFEETVQTLEIDTAAVAGLLREAIKTTMSGLWSLVL